MDRCQEIKGGKFKLRVHDSHRLKVSIEVNNKIKYNLTMFSLFSFPKLLNNSGAQWIRAVSHYSSNPY